MEIRVAKILYETMADMPGFSTSIYCQGCGHHCLGCHNTQTWDFNNGELYKTKDLFDIVMSYEFSDVTFTGGDPMFQAEAFTELAQMIKNGSNKVIWCYTGYTYEEIKKDPKMSQLLPFIDVLVDGRFNITKRDISLKFRGSSNQRIIHLKNGEIDYIEKNED
jgi:anaerobic ribonucleoside-triphosphate reductase activating protein